MPRRSLVYLAFAGVFLIAIGFAALRFHSSILGFGAGALSALPAAWIAWQWWEQRQVTFDFGVRACDGQGILWISNPGKLALAVQRLNIRTEGDRKSFELQETAPPAATTEIDITRMLRESPLGLWDDLDISFDFLSHPGRRGSSPRKPFHLMKLDGPIDKVSSGFGVPRSVKCPKCGIPGLFNVTDLGNEDEVPKRRIIVQRELRRSCPDHRSQWIRSLVDSDGRVTHYNGA